MKAGEAWIVLLIVDSASVSVTYGSVLFPPCLPILPLEHAVVAHLLCVAQLLMLAFQEFRARQLHETHSQTRPNPGVVAQICNPQHLKGQDRKVIHWRPAWATRGDLVSEEKRNILEMLNLIVNLTGFRITVGTYP